MKPSEKIEKLFEEVARGVYSSSTEMFETVHLNGTNLPLAETRPLFRRIYDWAEEHREELPDFYAETNLAVGIAEFLGEDFESGMKHLDYAYKLFAERNDEDGMAAASLYIGFTYRSRGEIEMALKYGLQALEQLYISGKYKPLLVVGYYWIGGVYAETGNLDEALRLFNNGLNVDSPEGVKYMGARLTSGIAGVYMKQKKYDLALEYYHKALDRDEVSTEDTFRGRGLTDLADYYYAVGNYEEAVRYNKEALAFRQQMNLQNGSVTNLMNLALIALKQNKTEEATGFYSRALALAERIGVRSKVYQIHKSLSDIYAEMGHVTESFEHFKKFHYVKEEVNHENMDRKVQNQVQLFHAEQTKKENALIKSQKKEIEKEKLRSDALLLNILPAEVAEELKQKGSAAAKLFNDVSVLYTDFKSFTSITERLSPQQLVDELNICFSAFDEIVEKHNIEKIKTVGDAYMAVCGLPVANPNHAVCAIEAAIEIRDFMLERLGRIGDDTFEVRIGIHSGPVVAGIVGIKKYAYDIWGDTVNTAARMEQSSEPGRINISQSTYNLVKDKFDCEYRGELKAKNKGRLKMYFVK